MAKASSVYSAFGMKTPQEVAQEEFEKKFDYYSGQRTGYQQAGAGLGLLLGSLFGGESEAMRKAKLGEEVVGGVQAEQAQRRSAEQAKASELEDFKSRLRKAGGSATETPELTPADMIKQQLTEAYRTNTLISQRLASVGLTEESRNAEQAALDAGLGLMSLETSLAERRKLEAETAAELAPNREGYGNYVDPTTKQPFFGYRIGPDVFTSEGVPVPGALKFQEGVVAGPGGTAIGARAGDVRGTLITDEAYEGLGAQEQASVSSQIAAEAERRLASTPKGQRTKSQSDLYKEIWEEIKNSGGVEETSWWQFWKDDFELTQPESTTSQTVTTQAQYDALPSGATYIGADGNTYRKP